MLGLQRYIFHYSGVFTQGWYLGPLTHVFTFGASLSQVRMVAELGKGTSKEILFMPDDWEKGLRKGFFIRRSILSALMGTDALQVPPMIRDLRQQYICKDSEFLRQFGPEEDIVSIQFYWKDSPSQKERAAASVRCGEGG